MTTASRPTAQQVVRPKKLAFAIATLLAPAFASTFSPNAIAQGDERLEEVIVTTERRALNLQDVAGTVQSLSADDLSELGVNTDFKNLQNVVTGLHIANQEGKLEVFLRGIGSSDSDFASDPSVATHYNNVYLPRPRSIGPMFFDVERVEVNKGPQGTLRGRNATGGTINILSKKPDFDSIGGGVTLGVGKFNQRHFEGVLNLPVSDTLAFRAAVYKEERDPYMTNAFNGSDNLEDLSAGLQGNQTRLEDATGGSFEAPGSLDDQAIRLSALYEPNDKFSLYVLADAVEQRGSSVPGAFTGRALSAGYDIEDLDDPYDQFFVNEGEMKNDIHGISGTASYDFGPFSLEYNGSYRTYDFQHKNAAREWQIGMNYPGAREEAETVIFGNEQTAYGNFIQAEVSDTTVHEIRLVSTDASPHIWSAGIFRMDEEYSNVSQDFSHGWWGDCDWYQDGTNCGWLNGLSAENRHNGSTVESTAVFADGTFSLTNSFRIKAGIRWTEDKKVARDSNANYQLIVTDEALAAVGLSGPQEIVMGTSGLELVAAGERPDNNVPTGTTPTPDMFDHWVEGIKSWGSRDNIDELVAYGQANPGAFQVLIASDFGEGNVVSEPDPESYVNWRLGFEADVMNDSLVYGTISTGTRAGGVNRQLPLQTERDENGDPVLDENDEPVTFSPGPVTWDKEELTVYEAGLKTEFDLAGLPVRTNMAAFYYDYRDKVLQGLVSVCDLALENQNAGADCNTNFIQNQNATNVDLYGFEIDGDILLPLDMRIRTNFAYLDSSVREGKVLDTRQGGNVLVDIEGNELPNTSKYNLNMALSQSIQLGGGIFDSFDWTFSGNYRSEYYLSIYNNQGFDSDGNPIPLEDMPVNSSSFITSQGFEASNGRFLSDKVPSTMIFNFNTGINFGSESQYRVEAWVSNLTDETYSTKAFINDSVNIRFLNTPRMYGMRFKMDI